MLCAIILEIDWFTFIILARGVFLWESCFPGGFLSLALVTLLIRGLALVLGPLITT